MSFFPSNAGPPFWQQMLLAVIPTFVGACLPPIIAHQLEQRAMKAAPPPPPRGGQVGFKSHVETKKVEEKIAAAKLRGW